MRDEANGYLGFGIFFLIIALIVLGGSYTLYHDSFKKETLEKQSENNESIDKEKISIKIDKNKDLIYFLNEEVISKSLGLTYKEIAFNFKTIESDALQKKLNEEIKTIKDSQVLVEDNSCVDNIKSTKQRDYAIFTTNDYLSLIISDSDYTCEDSFSIINHMQSYTFTLEDGKLLKQEELLKAFNLTMDNVITKIRKHLEDNQSKTMDGLDTIKVDESINNLKYNDNYMLYINELGKLEIKYIVKSNLVDYNDTIVF